MTNNADNTAAAVQRIRETLPYLAIHGWDVTPLVDSIATLESTLAARDRRIAELEAEVHEYAETVDAIQMPEVQQMLVDSQAKRIAELELERDNYRNRAQIAELRAERAERERDAAQEGRNLVVAELQRLQLEYGIKCVGGEPSRLRVLRDHVRRASERVASWPAWKRGITFARQPEPAIKPAAEAQEPLGAIADAGDTRECGCAQKYARKDEGATGEDRSQL